MVEKRMGDASECEEVFVAQRGRMAPVERVTLTEGTPVFLAWRTGDRGGCA